MLWRGRRESENVIDLQDEAPRRRGTNLGIGSVLLIGAAVYLMGGDPRIVLSLLENSIEQGVSVEGPSATSPEEQERNLESKQLVSVVLANLEDTWGNLLSEIGRPYDKPNLVLFRDGVETACGLGQSATGPFYCPGDSKVYLDFSFLEDLKRMGGSGDFAFAYVVAHEVGHHVQNLLGTEREIRNLQSGRSIEQANALQVRMELQADCYAGIWAHFANQEQNFIEPGDIEEGINAAAAVGDDHLQQMAGQRVSPESFTHGSSKDRVKWFKIGFQGGTLESCKII